MLLCKARQKAAPARVRTFRLGRWRALLHRQRLRSQQRRLQVVRQRLRATVPVRLPEQVRLPELPMAQHRRLPVHPIRLMVAIVVVSVAADAVDVVDVAAVTFEPADAVIVSRTWATKARRSPRQARS